MSAITRRKFLSRTSVATALATLPHSTWNAEADSQEWAGGEVGSAVFRLSLSPQEGLRKTRLYHVPSGLMLADGDYSYSFGRPEFHESRISEETGGSEVVCLRGSALEGQLELVQEWRIPREHPWIEEQITLINRGEYALDLHNARCGFLLPLAVSGGVVEGDWAPFKFTSIPFRREPNGHRAQYADFSLGQILTEQYSSELWTYETTVTAAFASEGWAWFDGKRGFLITKYSQKGMEWSLLDRLPLTDNRTGLRWGGYGIYRGDPEHGAWLAPRESHRFGILRLTAYQGGMLEGFYRFREEMAQRGHDCPKGFDPPVHWNELYDNKLFWLPGEGFDNSENRKKY